MKRFLTVWAVAFAASAFADLAQSADVPLADREKKLMSYNVRHCAGMDKKIDVERTAAVIRRENPDFVGLQELDRFTTRSGVDQPAELQRLTGLYATFAKATLLKGGEYGVMVLSREKPLSKSEVPLPGKEPRILLLCEFKDCVFGTTHLSVSAEKERMDSVELIRKAVAAYAGKKPVFLSGDWNATSDSDVVKALGSFLKVVSKTDGQTYHGKIVRGPDGLPIDMSRYCIDYIACDTAHAEKLAISDARVVDDRKASDHAPIVVTVR